LRCVVGLVGNALSFVVLRCDDDVKHATSWLLRALAVVDAFYLLTCLLIQPLRTVHNHTDWLPKTVGRAYTRLEPYVWPLASIAHTVTVWTVVLVTADRYAAVRWPCNKRLRSRLRAQLSVLAVVAGAFVYNLPMFFEMKTVMHRNVCSGEMEYQSRDHGSSLKLPILISFSRHKIFAQSIDQLCRTVILSPLSTADL